MVYDPVKAHDYYERTKHLKGRGDSQNGSKSGDANPRVDRQGHHPAPSHHADTQAVVARIGRLKSAVSKLEGALSQAEAALSKKRQEAQATQKKNSDGKSTVAEKKASQKYRDTHKAEVATKSKSSSSSLSGGGSSSSSPSSVSDMSVTELETRIMHIKTALANAKRQLSDAQVQLGQLAHSAITSEPGFNDNFARFRSAERMPSQ